MIDLIARARNPERGPDGRLLSLRDAVEISIFRPAASAARGSHRAERWLVLDLLEAVGAPMSPSEIERLLRLQHVVPAGRPSQTIVNALRPAVRRGQVTIVERGWYEAS